MLQRIEPTINPKTGGNLNKFKTTIVINKDITNAKIFFINSLLHLY